jgi:hypothetical protein
LFHVDASSPAFCAFNRRKFMQNAVIKCNNNLREGLIGSTAWVKKFGLIHTASYAKLRCTAYHPFSGFIPKQTANAEAKNNL